MKPLLNALAFAAVVIAAFVMDSNLPQRAASSPLMARVVQAVRGEQLPAVLPDGLPPQIDQARLEQSMARMRAAQERLARVDMKRLEVRMQAIQRRAGTRDCKVIRIDQ